MVALDFDATVAWPGYDWMGVAKSALESTARYLARDLGPTSCESTSWRPARSGRSPPGPYPAIARFEEVWGERAPLGWDMSDSSAVAKACVALLSDLFPATTGEMVHVDGGYPRHGGVDLVRAKMGTGA